MAGELKEKCAVVGVMTDGYENASTLAYEALFALQHRGTEATGMAGQMPRGAIESHIGPGMVRDVYDNLDAAERLRPTNPVVGHNRYSTSGSKKKHPQPVIDEAVGLAIGHNGNLPDTSELEAYLDQRNLLHSDVNDSEMIGMAIAQMLRDGKDLPGAIAETYPMMKGAFSCVGMQDGLIVAFRDPSGIRPLALGKRENGHIVASETCALDAVGAEYVREVRPGELIIISPDGVESQQLAVGESKLDIFELVYFARHDSRLYGKSVNEIRREFGRNLARQHGSPYENTENTIVVPVPDTSIPEAEGYAEELGLRQRQLIVKSRYVGRTFMQTTDKARQEQLRFKHNIIDEGVKGKDLILVDDSIVRLNTIPRIVALAKHAGAHSVSVLIGSPPVRFPDFYGIDTPSQDELAAANMTIEQMRKEIGCKYLGFLSLDEMVKATGEPAEKFNLSCFNGVYPIDIGRRKREINTPVSMESVDY